MMEKPVEGHHDPPGSDLTSHAAELSFLNPDSWCLRSSPCLQKGRSNQATHTHYLVHHIQSCVSFTAVTAPQQ